MRAKRLVPTVIILISAVATATGVFAMDGCSFQFNIPEKDDSQNMADPQSGYRRTRVDHDRFPDYTGEAYVEINDNIPELDLSDGKDEFEIYMPLDSFGRCTETYANVSRATMPSEPRGSIGMVRPSGWHLIKYEGIDGGYLFNRCHLIGYQLTGENANEENLITGTRYLNTVGMLPFENAVADYVKETGHHVLYKVIPVFEGTNLVAKGVWMQAASVEDDGLAFNVFCYNIQPGIVIDYATGESAQR